MQEEITKYKYSEMISKMYDIRPEVLAALEAGSDNVVFKEIVQGVFAAIDQLVTENIIEDNKSFEIKYQLYDMMNWASGHLIEFNR